jgi:hypothetical protein
MQTMHFGSGAVLLTLDVQIHTGASGARAVERVAAMRDVDNLNIGFSRGIDRGAEIVEQPDARGDVAEHRITTGSPFPIKTRMRLNLLRLTPSASFSIIRRKRLHRMRVKAA